VFFLLGFLSGSGQLWFAFVFSIRELAEGGGLFSQHVHWGGDRFALLVWLFHIQFCVRAPAHLGGDFS